RLARRRRAPPFDHLGMNDLQSLAIVIELARDDAALADRQQPLRIAALLAEIDQADMAALIVGRLDAERRAGGAAAAMRHRGQPDGNDAADIPLVDRR